MRLGFMHHLLGADRLDEAFARASSLGLDGLEVSYGPQQASWLADPDHSRELQQLAARNNLAVCSLCMGFVCTGPSLVEAPAEISRAIETIERGIGVASDAGAKVVLVPFFGASAIEVEAELTRAIDAITELSATAERLGVVLGVESTLNLNQQQFLLEHFAGSDFVKIYYDTGNALGRKLDLPTMVRQLGPAAIAGMHFKDIKTAPSAPPDSAIKLGQGNVDFSAVVQAMRAVKYDGWVVLETPPLDDAMNTARENIKFARDLLK
jgi:hexulose-6-phosphate isomerase